MTDREFQDRVDALMHGGMMFGEAVLTARLDRLRTSGECVTKRCERCGKLYARGRFARDSVWDERRFCGSQCAGLNRRYEGAA